MFLSTDMFFYNLIGLIHWKSLLKHIWSKSLCCILPAESSTRKRFSNNYLHDNLLPSFNIKPALSIFYLSSLISPQPSPLPNGFKSNSKWQFTSSYNAKRKGILIKLRISKCPFAKAIYSRGAKASFYNGHVPFTSWRTCFMHLNHE